MMVRQVRFPLEFGFILVILLCGNVAAASCAEYRIGLNKFDLALEYIGRASGGNGDREHTRITRAMAQKAIGDALRLNVSFFRISAMGYAPVKRGEMGDLTLWLKDPGEYWQLIDQMFADLQTARICVIPVFLWNWIQVPAVTNESFHELLDNPHSASWRLLEKYVREFVGRYRREPALYFYELTNELNLLVDLDNEGRCRKEKGTTNDCQLESNFTTKEMEVFTSRLSALIRSLDNAHKISSGFSLPPPHAYHLSLRPEWSKLGPDWTADSAENFKSNLGEIHRAVDIISVHLYASNSERFGLTPETEANIVGIVQVAAAKIGKPLFVGEFGQPDPRHILENSFVNNVIAELQKFKVKYSAVWVWEFYQSSTTDASSSYSLEPGYTDGLITSISTANGHLMSGAPPGSRISERDKRDTRDTRAFPQVVITNPIQCSKVENGTELFAVASGAGDLPPTVYFYLNGIEVAHVAGPPYVLSLPAVVNMDQNTALLEARECMASMDCAAFKTRVVIKDGPNAMAECLATEEPVREVSDLTPNLN